MKNTLKYLLSVLVGMAIMFIFIKVTTPFEYNYDKENGIIEFTVDNEIVSDYDSEWRFADEDNYGTTFKVWFEDKE